MSGSKALEEYRCLEEEYAEARRLVKGLGEITAEVSQCLTTEPYRLTFSDMGMDIPLRPDFPGKPLVCAPGQWPTPEAMAEAVNRQYRAERALREAWGKLSAEEKKRVGPPPESIVK